MAEAKKKKAAARPASERAQEALDVATRLVAATEDRLKKAREVVTGLESDLSKAKARRDYAALNPDLQNPPHTVPGTDA